MYVCMYAFRISYLYRILIPLVHQVASTVFGKCVIRAPQFIHIKSDQCMTLLFCHSLTQDRRSSKEQFKVLFIIS